MFSPGGTMLLIASKSIIIVDANSLNIIMERHDDEPTYDSQTNTTVIKGYDFAHYNHLGNRIVAYSNKKLSILDASTLQELKSTKKSVFWVVSGSFSPDDTKIITSSQNGSTKLWNAETLLDFDNLKGDTYGVKQAIYSPNGRNILTMSDSCDVVIWDAFTFEKNGILKGNNHNFYSVMSCDSNSQISIWLSKSLELIFDIKLHRVIKVNENNYLPNTFRQNWKRRIEESPDGTKGIYHSKDYRSIIVYQKSDKHMKEYTDCEMVDASSEFHDTFKRDSDDFVGWRKTGELAFPNREINDACFSPDGRKVLVSYMDGLALVWDINSLKCVGILGKSDLSAFYMSDGEKIVTASWNNIVNIWDAFTFRCVFTFVFRPGMDVFGCDFRELHPDSKLSDEDKQLLWEYGARFNNEDTPPSKESR